MNHIPQLRGTGTGLPKWFQLTHVSRPLLGLELSLPEAVVDVADLDKTPADSGRCGSCGLRTARGSSTSPWPALLGQRPGAARKSHIPVLGRH